MKPKTNIVVTLLFSFLLALTNPSQTLASYPDIPQGSGYPFTRVISGQISAENCPNGFQFATGLIADLSWPRGQREFTECWQENAFVAHRIGGETWQRFVASGGTYDPEADRLAELAYHEAVAAAQAAAEQESKEWNAANPGQQRCVQWGPIIGPNGQESSGGVCANVVPLDEASISNTVPLPVAPDPIPTPTSSPTSSIEAPVEEPNVSEPPLVSEPTPTPAPVAEPQAPLADGTYERICSVMGWPVCAEWRIKNSAGAEVNRVIGPHPESSLRAICGSGLCGGGLGGSVELIRLVIAMPAASEPIEQPSITPVPELEPTPSVSDTISAEPEPAPSPNPEPTPTPSPSPETSPTPSTGLGGYAVVHPQTGVVCGVIVATGPLVMSSDYMGCPVGSNAIFQTFPSETGNVAGYHGPDVVHRGGTFYLSWGTITDGIATDSNGRVWETGTGRLIQEGNSQPVPSNTSSSSVTVSTESSAVEGNEAPGVDISSSPVVSLSPSITQSLTVSEAISTSSSPAADFSESAPLENSQPVNPGPSTDSSTASPSTSSSSELTSGSASQPVETPTISPDPGQPTTSESAQVFESLTQPEIVIGTFQGRWAIRIANLEGATISIRAGGNWYKINLAESRVFFSRKSAAGVELPVTIWINGTLALQQAVEIVP